MPWKSLFHATPWLAILLLAACNIAVSYGLRGKVFVIAGLPPETVAVARAEFVCVIVGVIVMLLIAPTMPNVDLRRRRARYSAVVRFIIGVLVVFTISAITARFNTMDYLRQVAGSIEHAVPESELLINNTLLITCLAGCLAPLTNKAFTAIASIAAWIAGYIPAVIHPGINLWPLDYYHGPGPWFSLPHIAVTATLALAAIIIQYATAGTRNHQDSI